jgi:hypothetical protein
MGFSMRASPEAEPAPRRAGRSPWPRWGLWLAALLALTPVHAEDFTIRAARTHLVNQVHLLNASIDYRFSDRALQALESGVPITVRVDIEVRRKRDYWLDKVVAELEQRYQLQYHALSGSYLLRNLNSNSSEVFLTMEAALASVGVINDLPIIDDKLLESDSRYEVALQTRLDIESLPSPLRPWAYVTPSWRLSSDWYAWSLDR